jgi:ribose-phosphate pyrophosphokinase
LIKNKIYDKGVTVVSPDVGGVERATILAERLGADLAIVAKRRPEPGKVKVIDVIGDVENQVCVLIDDLIDSVAALRLQPMSWATVAPKKFTRVARIPC